MSPPIRDGSGSNIGSIRLGDGSEISEVRTGAGDVLFSAIPDSVIHRWKFDEGSGDPSDSIGSWNLTTNGGVTWVSDSQSVGDNHLSYVGDDDYLDGGDITPPSQISFGGWYYFDTISGTQYLIDMGHSGANGQNITFLMGDGSIGKASHSDGELLVLIDGNDVATGFIPNADTWYHLTVTYASDGTLILWVDAANTFETTAGDGTVSDSSNPLSVGVRSFDQGGGFYAGDMDDQFVADAPLTQSEVDDMRNQSPRA